MCLCAFKDRTGCFISDQMDMILFPGPYETADEYHAKILEKVVHKHTALLSTCGVTTPAPSLPFLPQVIAMWLSKRYVEDLRIEKKR